MPPYWQYFYDAVHNFLYFLFATVFVPYHRIFPCSLPSALLWRYLLYFSGIWTREPPEETEIKDLYHFTGCRLFGNFCIGLLLFPSCRGAIVWRLNSKLRPAKIQCWITRSVDNSPLRLWFGSKIVFDTDCLCIRRLILVSTSWNVFSVIFICPHLNSLNF